MQKADKDSIQSLFLKKIEDIIPSHSTLVYELSEVLGISNDSAYRRIRGKTALSIEDVTRLCKHFQISFDSFSSSESGNVTFNYTIMNKDEQCFEDYLDSLLRDIKIVSSAQDKQMIYACEDIPVFHNYNYPILAAFKMFYWMKSIMNVPSLEGQKFDASMVSDKLKETGKKVYELYTSVPSIEIWTETTIQGTLKQIDFYWDSGMFTSEEDALSVCKTLKQEITDIQRQAELGKKFVSEERISEHEDNYTVYFSEIEITNNCVLVSFGDNKQVYLGHQTFNTMATGNMNYCVETEVWLNNIIKKSTLISGVSEKHRYQYFNKLFTQIDALIKKIEGE